MIKLITKSPDGHEVQVWFYCGHFATLSASRYQNQNLTETLRNLKCTKCIEEFKKMEEILNNWYFDGGNFRDI